MCENNAWARKALGVDVAGALQRRLADLEAAEVITDLPWLNIVFGADCDAAIEIHVGYWLNIVAIPGAPPMDGNQKFDWTTVDRVKLIGIQLP